MQFVSATMLVQVGFFVLGCVEGAAVTSTQQRLVLMPPKGDLINKGCGRCKFISNFLPNHSLVG